MTPQERDMAVRTLLAEAGREGPAGMAAVASVILNRAKSGRYGRGVGGVIQKTAAFEPWANHVRGTANDPRRFDTKSKEYDEAGMILDAVASGIIPDITGGMTHFVAPKAQAALGRVMPSWAKGEGRAIGNHTFFAPEGKAMYDPSDYDALSRSTTPTQIQPPKPVAGMLPTPSAPAAPSMSAPGAPKAPSGNLLGRMMGGDASRPMQSWADVLAGAGPQSPLLFRALSYGMQPSPGSGGPAANAGGGPGALPSAPAPAASNPVSLPSAAPSGDAAGSGPLDMLKGLFRGMTPAPQTPAPTGGVAGIRGDAGGGLGILANLFKAI